MLRFFLLGCGVVKLRYSPVLYLPLLLLQILCRKIRIAADFSGWTELRSLSGFLTVAAVVLFAVTIASVSGRAPASDSASHPKRVGAD
jgi:hypothetical protein